VPKKDIKTMPATTAEETLGEFFGSIALRNLVKKKIFGDYEVPLGPLITRVSFWMFQVGSILGRVLQDRLAVLIKMIPMTVDGPNPEQKVCDILTKLAADRLERYGRRPASLSDYWLSTEFDFSFKDTPIEALKHLCQGRVPLSQIFSNHKLDEWLSYGIGFGATFPQLLEDLWSKEFENVDEKAWAFARSIGVSLPKEPTLLPLKDTESDILADTARYTQKNFPELLKPLGLRVS
jgi:hypothetical protein